MRFCPSVTSPNGTGSHFTWITVSGRLFIEIQNSFWTELTVFTCQLLVLILFSVEIGLFNCKNAIDWILDCFFISVNEIFLWKTFLLEVLYSSIQDWRPKSRIFKISNFQNLEFSKSSNFDKTWDEIAFVKEFNDV